MLNDELLYCSTMRVYAASSRLATCLKGIGVLERRSSLEINLHNTRFLHDSLLVNIQYRSRLQNYQYVLTISHAPATYSLAIPNRNQRQNPASSAGISSLPQTLAPNVSIPLAALYAMLHAWPLG